MFTAGDRRELNRFTGFMPLTADICETGSMPGIVLMNANRGSLSR